MIGAWLIMMVAAGCAQRETTQMSPDELYALIRTDTPPLILDVRTLREYRSGHVPGAIHRPFYELLGREPEVQAASDAPVVVYCAHGPRAGIAAWGLRRSGYTQVMYLQGNMAAWKEREFPVERETSESDKSD